MHVSAACQVCPTVADAAVTEAICDRGTRIQGTKGELIGDMATFVGGLASTCLVRADAQTVFDFLSRVKSVHTPPMDGGGHGGGDLGLSKAFVEAVARKDQTILGVTPEEILNSHLLVFAAEKARRDERVVRFNDFKSSALRGETVFP